MTEEPKPTQPKVLLIGWDAADWNFIHPLLDAGRMPHLARLVDQGVIGNLASLQPHLSPILWTSIATGKTADKHGITGFVEPAATGGLRLTSSTSRRCKALWNIVSQNGLRPIVIHWLASHPAEPVSGTVATNLFFENPHTPAPPHSVHPADLTEILSNLRMHPAELTAGDLRQFIPALDEAAWNASPLPRKLAEILAKTVSIHAAATAAMEAEPWDFLAVYYDGLDLAGHEFMPFHPPRLPWIAEADFLLYQHIMTELYGFFDEMLGRLLELAGEETTVLLVSDHGFHHGHLRPPPQPDHASEAALAAAWHRAYGVIALRGPGIRQDERIYGTTLLDIAPTVLALLGLPVAKDMDGRVIASAFVDPPPTFASIPTWEGAAEHDGTLPPDAAAAMLESPEMVRQFVDLGYLPASFLDGMDAVENALNESAFNLAIVHNAHGRPKEAKEILSALHQKHPQQPRFTLALAKTLANLGEHDACLHLLESFAKSPDWNLDAELLRAAELFNTGKTTEARERLAAIQPQTRQHPGFLLVTGRIHLACEAWPDAIDALSRCVGLNPDDAHAHQGLAFAAWKLDRFEEAADHSLRAVALLFHFPQAHFVLGMSFKALGDPDRAIQSLNVAVSQAPGFREAHQELAKLHEIHNRPDLRSHHDRAARGMMESN